LEKLLAFLVIIICLAGSESICAQAQEYYELSSAEDKNTQIIDNYITTGENMFRSRELDKSREAFENILKIDSQNFYAQYYLGLIEYEEGNTEKARIRFQIAYEFLPDSIKKNNMKLPADTEVQLEFPDEYQANVYYKDGWYIKPKNISANKRTSLEAGSNYRIELKPDYRKPLMISSIAGILVLVSFLLAR